MAARANQLAWLATTGLSEELCRETAIGSHRIIKEQAANAAPYIKYFLQDNSKRSAEDLADLAAHLSPGGVHNGSLLMQIARANLWADDA